MTDNIKRHAPDASFAQMLDLIKQLRSENGCPWDRKQTIESFHPYILEEYHELVHAISQHDTEGMMDEAGDLIFLITFVIYMFEQEGICSVNQVIEGAVSKMTLRHPHVFGDLKVANSEEVIDNWAKIKSSEKLIRDRNSLLDGIPRTAPALTRAHKITSRASRVGFDWPDAEQVMGKVYEELLELTQTMKSGDSASIRSEFGDVLFSIVNLGRHLGLNSESALGSASDRFEERFHYIEQKLKAAGKSPESASLAEMDMLWDEAKSRLG